MPNTPTTDRLPESIKLRARRLTNDLFQDVDNESLIDVATANAICEVHARKIGEVLLFAKEEERNQIEKKIRSMITWNQQNRAYTETTQPWNDNIKLLDEVINLAVNPSKIVVASSPTQDTEQTKDV